ncbi:MAG TPA: 30S ribosomal protein S8 [Longimicrobiales bacterium]|nr:30S ribosomal protein S8 [Longimicrobiales bacterium]
MMTDPIADMLTRIRNAGQAGHRWVDMPPSKLKAEIARLLKDNHFVFDYKVLDDGGHGVLRVYLKYHDGQPVIRHLERVSRPGRRHYVRADDVPRVRNGLGMAILSTSRGLMSDRGARQERMGGELMALVW